MIQTPLTIQNVGKILSSERDFKWISYRELDTNTTEREI